MVQDARALLAQAIKDKSDEEIMQLVENMGGVDTVLETTFQGMREAFDPARAQDCVIGFALAEGGTTHHYTVKIEGKQASYERGEPSGARVTLGLSVPDWLRLVAGQLDGIGAFMQGKLKLTGDIMFAQQIPSMFGL